MAPDGCEITTGCTPMSQEPRTSGVTDTQYTVVHGNAGLRQLEADLRGDRSYPIVILTSEENTREPVIPPEDVRSVIGATGRIYFIPGAYRLRQLRSMLGPELAVPCGSARVFWPGLSAQSDPETHPVVAVLLDEAPWGTLAAFTRAFDLSRPHVRAEIIQLDDSRRMQELQRAAAEERNAVTEQRLRDAQYELHRIRTAGAQTSRYRTTTEPVAKEVSCEELLHVLITRGWLSELTAEERRKHPLGRYVLMPRFIEQLESQTQSVREHVAWVCAMLAAAYPDAATYTEENTTPSEPQAARSDNATRGMLYIQHAPPDVAHLIYWVRADSTVEFAELGP